MWFLPLHKFCFLDQEMFKIYKLTKTDWRQAADGAYHTPRNEDWKFTWVGDYATVEEANLNLKNLITTDDDPASDWRKKKVYAGNPPGFYELYISNDLNYHHRKYFITTTSYSVEVLMNDIKGSLNKDGVRVVLK